MEILTEEQNTLNLNFSECSLSSAFPTPTLPALFPSPSLLPPRFFPPFTSYIYFIFLLLLFTYGALIPAQAWFLVDSSLLESLQVSRLVDFAGILMESLWLTDATIFAPLPHDYMSSSLMFALGLSLFLLPGGWSFQSIYPKDDPIFLRGHLLNYVYRSFISNSQKLETTQLSLNYKMDKWNVLHLHNKILLRY